MQDQMLRQQTQIPESSQPYVWLWQPSFFSDSPIELTSEHQVKFVSFHIESVYVIITGCPRLGLPENLKNSVQHSITSVSAMQTPSGFKIIHCAEMNIGNVFITVFAFIALEYWVKW